MDPLFNAHNPKRVSDAKVSPELIRDFGRGLGFTVSGARTEFEEMLKRAQTGGGITREEVHEILQKLILKGKITKDQARRMATALGLIRKDFRVFDDMSDWRASHISSNTKGQVGADDGKKSENLQTKFEDKFALARAKDMELRRSRDLEAKLDRKEKDLNEKLGKKETASPTSIRNDNFGGRFDKKPSSSEEDPEDHPISVINKPRY